jgi:hypothetical protein
MNWLYEDSWIDTQQGQEIFFFTVVLDFLSSGSGMGSTQPHEDN